MVSPIKDPLGDGLITDDELGCSSPLLVPLIKVASGAPAVNAFGEDLFQSADELGLPAARGAVEQDAVGL